MSVRMGLLALLAQGDSYGYQLRVDFEAATGTLWPLNVGQVYSTLERLEQAGLVQSEDRPNGDADAPQRWYGLTRRGEQELAAWFEAPDVDEVPPRDGFQAKVLLALVAGPDVATQVIAAQRAALTGVLQRRRAQLRRRRDQGRAADSTDGDGNGALRLRDGLAPLADELVDEAVISRTESALRWLDLCDARIAEIVGSRPAHSGRKR